MIQITSHSQEAALQKEQSINGGGGGGPDIKVKIHLPNLFSQLLK